MQLSACAADRYRFAGAVRRSGSESRKTEADPAKVGGYCDISKWLDTDCVIKSGDAGIGTVRLLRGGQVTEILVAKTDLSYGYTQPVREGQSDKPDQAARQTDVGQRRARFEGALKKMKELVEAP